MALYRYRIKPESALATPFRSDTLYGHLLWMAAQWEGAERVTELIEAFDGPNPPFRLSNAFPAGTLPKPHLPGIPRDRFASEFRQHGDLVTVLQKYKKFRKLKYIDLDVWQVLRGRLSQEALFAHWLANQAQDASSSEKITSRQATQPHNSIDRNTGSVLREGGLHFAQATWFGQDVELDLYVESENIETFETLFEHLSKVGYGADRSVGKGQFSYERDESFESQSLVQQGDYQLSLSVCAAQDCREFDGYWKPMVKHGRTWSGFGEKNPFKKPFLAFTEGSLFNSMPTQGYLLRNIHSNPEIVQVTWPLTIPVTLEVDHAS